MIELRGVIPVFECDKCWEIYTHSASAALCCGTSGYFGMFQCSICKTNHHSKDVAAKCFSEHRKAEPDTTPLRKHLMRLTSKPRKSTPDPNCEYCAMARRFGTVISCRCMK